MRKDRQKNKRESAYTNKRRKYSMRSTQLSNTELVEGETIEQKVERLVQNKEPIKDGAPEIFTQRKEGVGAAYNIRSDRWEIATEAMDKVNKSKVAKRDGKGKVISLKAKIDGDDDKVEPKGDKGKEGEA